jgi:hypothetical protein
MPRSKHIAIHFMPIGLITFLGRLMMIAAVLFACASFLLGQSGNNSGIPTDPVIGKSSTQSPQDDSPFASMDEEMRAKRAIKYAEKEYQENVDRAHDLSDLGAEIVESFKRKNSLDRDDLKKLDKLEKLVKAIRHAAGGSEDEPAMDKPPTDLSSTVGELGKVSESLKEKVEKTPRHVVSAAVIDQANVLLELIRVARTFSSKV